MRCFHHMCYLVNYRNTPLPAEKKPGFVESHKFIIYLHVPETLKVFLLFLDLLRVSAGASGAKLDVSSSALRWALNVILQFPLVPNSICFCWRLRRQTRFLRNSLWRSESHL